MNVRDLRKLEMYRVRSQEVVERFGSVGDSTCGAFVVPNTYGEPLRILASAGEGWDHVSVSCVDRCPTWDEMEQIKRLFFKPSETAMQLHVTPKEHINVHPHCLHLWRPQKAVIPLPPGWMVG